jgi:FlaA1/EpsC-like NDP-sugar epimerase
MLSGPVKTPLLEFVLQYRRVLIVLLHIGLVALSNYVAFLLRFEGIILDREWAMFLAGLPWLLAIRGIIFLPLKLYEGLWRYTGIWDLRNIILGVLASTCVFFGVVHGGLGQTEYPRSVFVIDSLLLVMFLGGVRLSRRIYRELGHSDREKGILIYGAGDAGEMIVRDIINNPYYEYEPIGFLDDDPKKFGRRIHGLKVLGGREVLAQVIKDKSPHAVLVAIPRAEPAMVRKLVRVLEPFKIPIMTLPNLRDVLGGRVEVSQIRNLSIEDLLERAPVGLDSKPIEHLVKGKRVLVTGAGGSIGSELSRQIARLDPSSLVLIDRYENGLFAVSTELVRRYGESVIQAVIGDVTDIARMQKIFEHYRPEIVFHAAAHKHVPLMEASPCEAIKNNVRGTRILAELAAEFDVQRFILISTDKAVNPTSVMGATKRVAEMLTQVMNRRGATIFSAVRFGNVLGSNGSVVPLFLDQIKAGGPVTVTHPDMRRYFMLIPEAVHLVLHAAALAEGGEVFVLEMGEQIKIVDMARNLIRLSGLVPDEDIAIQFTGCRPGEKLYEELVGMGEVVEPSEVPRILRVRTKPMENSEFYHRIMRMEQLADSGEVKQAADELKAILSPSLTPLVSS